MEAKFTEFLISLAEEPKKLVALQENPDSFLATTNLTPAEKAIIKSGNSALIRAAISEEFSHQDSNHLLETVAGGATLFLIFLWPFLWPFFREFTREFSEGDIQKRLIQLKEAIESEPSLKAEDKAEALEQVKVLAEANKNSLAMQKQARTALKILRGTVSELASTAKLVEKSKKLLPAIAQHLSLG